MDLATVNSPFIGALALLLCNIANNISSGSGYRKEPIHSETKVDFSDEKGMATYGQVGLKAVSGINLGGAANSKIMSINTTLLTAVKARI